MPDHDLPALLRRCEQHALADARRHRDVYPADPFEALLNPSTELVWLNYAVPVAPLDDPQTVAEGLSALEQIFATHERTLRFEFNEALWPTLAPMLEAAGLVLQARQPLMILTPDGFHPLTAPGVEVGMLDASSDDETLARFLRVQEEGFEESLGQSLAEARADLRRSLGAGKQRIALASYEGVPAGAGSILILDEICELAGVATLAALRRRGVAASLCSVLLDWHFTHGGVMAWLSAGDDGAAALYQRLGFRLVDARLNYIMPEQGATTADSR